jgi:nucleotide-binding universal stress UspA family protein
MIKKILVPTDGSTHARKAVEFASEFALKYKATLHLIHVVSPLTSIAEGYVDRQIEDHQQKVAKEIIGKAEKEIKKKGIESYQSTIRKGNPAQEILEFASGNNVDMIIMGCRGAGMIETLMLGSVSQRVCHLADCTCVTVK